MADSYLVHACLVAASVGFIAGVFSTSLLFEYGLWGRLKGVLKKVGSIRIGPKPSQSSYFRIMRVKGSGTTGYKVEYSRNGGRWNAIETYPTLSEARGCVDGYLNAGEELVFEYDPNLKRIELDHTRIEPDDNIIREEATWMQNLRTKK